MKKAYNWLETLQQGNGKRISRLFFVTFTTEARVTKFLYPKTYQSQQEKNPKKKYVDKNINRLCRKWEEENFFEKSKPIPIKIKNRWGRMQKSIVFWKIMNFEPIYKYCAEKNIIFTKQEKSFLRMYLLWDKARIEILKQFKEDDIINATLKFYVKNAILRRYFLLRDISENPKKYKEEIKKAEDLRADKPEFVKDLKNASKKVLLEFYKKTGKNITKKKIKQYARILDKDLELTNEQVILHTIERFPVNPENTLLREYVQAIHNNKEMILSLDNKILKALNLSPVSLLEPNHSLT